MDDELRGLPTTLPLLTIRSLIEIFFKFTFAVGIAKFMKEYIIQNLGKNTFKENTMAYFDDKALLAAKLKFCAMEPGTVFTTLHFLRILNISPVR